MSNKTPSNVEILAGRYVSVVVQLEALLKLLLPSDDEMKMIKEIVMAQVTKPQSKTGKNRKPAVK